MASGELVGMAEKLAPFQTARRIGNSALQLERQSADLRRTVADMKLPEVVLPDGTYFRVRAYAEDFLDVEYSPEFNVRDAQPAWHKIEPHKAEDGGFSIHSSLAREQYGVRQALFFGNRMAYDKASQRIWIYSSDNAVRVEYRDGVGYEFSDDGIYQATISYFQAAATDTQTYPLSL